MSDYITYRNNDYQSDLEYSKQFLFTFGSNYAKATKLFPKQAREDTIIFYSFLRYVDEIVDNPDKDFDGKDHDKVDDFVIQWNKVVTNGPDESTHSVMRSTYWLFTERNIPFEYTMDFLAAMKQDLRKTRYETYRELRGYMWGSASIVGHVMTYVLGCTDPVAFTHAQALAEAMQLANFLRDVDEDYTERNRIYLPQIDMKAFGVSDEDIKKQIMTEPLRNLIRYYVSVTDTLFTEGNEGICYLEQGRYPLYFASYRYRYYLYLIKKRNYDIFSSSLKISKFQQIRIMISSYFIYLKKQF